ncbi:glycine cleavage T C-terminal barrel domain-containing protein, partial [Novosphingobium sp.]|uniref:glycine cleavage T C-terminal barrel domain-containing protein n=1 Tax=Novosphingobium sp. TaxID=1874826 RepID=UPI002B45B505
PGAERVLALLSNGPPTIRVGLALEGRMAAREGAKVLHGDREVGTVTSGGFSPSLQQPIAMAYIESALAVEGTPLEIEMRGRRFSTRIVPMPFVPHRYYR